MKRCMALMLSILLLIILGACGRPSDSLAVIEKMPASESPSAISQTESAQPQNTDNFPLESEPSEDDNTMASITLTVGNSIFSVKLYDNDTTRTFLARLPMTINMSELNGNEKYYYLPDNLPADSQRVESISAGDLMLYGSDCLVLFYESFNTSYSYTKLGYIEDVSGLANAIGHSSTEIMFSVGI